jgi:hypothetical protein
MPTPGGLPKVGEIWEKRVRRMAGSGDPVRFVVLERTSGSEWGMRVAYIVERDGRKLWERTLWVDCSYGLQQGWYKYIGPASAEVKFELGLGPAPKAKVSREYMAAQLTAFLANRTAMVSCDDGVAESVADSLIKAGWVTATPALRRQP